jgi:hemerythrin superfamily protein
VDAIKQLTKDHRTVDDLFARFESASRPEEKQDVAREFIRELSIHAALEEQLVYPAIRLRLEGGSKMANHSIQEHQGVKRLLADLEKLKADNPKFQEKAEALMRDVRKHVAEEEGEIFPKLREATSAERLDRMGQLMERAKGLMPTHPHPLVPGTATAQLLAGPWASIADHIRDFAESLRR